MAVKAAGDRPDITDYLKDLPADWLSDSASLLHFSGATQGQNGEPEPADSQLSAVMQGQKAVRVPPGGCHAKYPPPNCNHSFDTLSTMRLHRGGDKNAMCK